jgi:hypothetical protein
LANLHISSVSSCSINSCDSQKNLGVEGGEGEELRFSLFSKGGAFHSSLAPRQAQKNLRNMFLNVFLMYHLFRHYLLVFLISKCVTTSISLFKSLKKVIFSLSLILGGGAKAKTNFQLFLSLFLN